MNKYYFEGIMSLEKNKDISIADTIGSINGLASIKLLMEDVPPFRVYYECDVNELLSKDISNEDVMRIRMVGGWDYDKETEKLKKFI